MENFIETKKPLFTIIMCAYNAEATINRALDSFISQTFSNYEIVIVNDGSVDKTLQICKDYANKNLNIKIISQENKGIAASRFTGLSNANGQYVCYFDADDYIDKHLLYRCNNAINKYQDLDVIIFNYIEKNIHGVYEPHHSFDSGYYNKDRLISNIFPYIIYQEDLIPYPWRFVFKKDLLLDHYCKNFSIKKYEDACFTLETILYSRSMYIIDEPLYYFINTNTNSTFNSKADNFTNFIPPLCYLVEHLWNEDNPDYFSKCKINEQLAHRIARDFSLVFNYYICFNINYIGGDELIDTNNIDKMSLLKIAQAIKNISIKNEYKIEKLSRWAIRNMTIKGERKRRITYLKHHSKYSKLTVKLCKNSHYLCALIMYWLIFHISKVLKI